MIPNRRCLSPLSETYPNMLYKERGQARIFHPRARLIWKPFGLTPNGAYQSSRNRIAAHTAPGAFGVSCPSGYTAPGAGITLESTGKYPERVSHPIPRSQTFNIVWGLCFLRTFIYTPLTRSYFIVHTHNVYLNQTKGLKNNNLLL